MKMRMQLVEDRVVVARSKVVVAVVVMVVRAMGVQMGMGWHAGISAHLLPSPVGARVSLVPFRAI